VQLNRRYRTIARRFPAAVVAILLVGLCQSGRITLSLPALAAEENLSMAQALTSQRTDPDKPGGQTAITRGMEKQAVRTVWGEPEEVRKIRTCFGWQEEWVYRGDPKRFGASERVLLFDEGEVLTEIR